METVTYKELSNAVKFLATDAVEKAKSGHPGLPMGCADLLTVLFYDFLKFDPEHPKWENRDRFVLSAGHGSAGLYALLHLTGYADFTLDALKNFRQLHAATAGHPEYGFTGVETTTGPLGQGLATAVGMALAERIKNARFGDEVVNYFTYVLASDGDLMEGVSHEAIELAARLHLRKLIVLYDDNGITIDGKTDLSFASDTKERFEAAGWNVRRVDGHDYDEVYRALQASHDSQKPSIIICKTVIGAGSPNKAGTSGVHGSPLGAEELAATKKAENWNYPAFETPNIVAKAWADSTERGKSEHVAWRKKVQLSGHAEEFSAFESGALHPDLKKIFKNLREEFIAKPETMATRVASYKVLTKINPVQPGMVGGSADLTPSNNTKTPDMKPFTKADRSGNYIHYGVREHAMAACMNGLALSGGIIPYGGTFLTFSDYSRPAIRLAALMGIRVIHVMTHDSVGLGEDGPTHQPVEHLAALRAIPNLNVFRPADAVETAEVWEIALSSEKTPSILSLSRQNLPAVRTASHGENENMSANGAYILQEAEGDLRVVILASGSEVSIALKARESLQAEKIGARVVSVPCLDLFRKKSAIYREKILPKNTLTIAVEAAVSQSWEAYITDEDCFVGMKGFGASAPYEDLYKEFGITAEKITEIVKNKLR